MCSPKAVGSSSKNMSDLSCYSKDDLMRLKNVWNKRNPDNLIHSTEYTDVWNELKTKFGNTCSNEHCWYKKFSDVNELQGISDDLFAPVSPTSWKSNPSEWLSSTDIINVMKQYMKIYKCFQFLGPAPIDFDKVITGSCVDELCNFDLKQLIANGKFKIGISINTDPHNKGGEHWISMFVNIKKGFIFYFDSGGDKAPKQVVSLANRIIKQGAKLTPPIKFKFDQNYPNQHQYTTTECGMYSLYFIVSMLEDKLTQQYLKTHVITDKYIQNLRKKYYNEDL
jgi:hypothetical protein